MTPPPQPLLGFQRRYLRKLAHGRRPVVFVGDAGVSEAVIRALGDALSDHELVKVKLAGAEEKKAVAEELAKRSDAHLCGVVGHMAILFRPSPDDPVIELPTRRD